MKISIASPSTGTQKSFDIDDEKKLVLLHDKRISQDFRGEILGDQFNGYVFKITGGSDKDGFPMKQGVLTSCRVRLLLNRGDVGYQAWRGRKGERRRKSVRGCIVAGDISLLNCIIIKEGPEKIEGLNDHIIPRKLGPKRASKIRKLFNLSKDDDVRKYVIRRYLPPKEGKDGKIRRGRSKAPKIQRLVTPVVIARWRRRKHLRLEKRIKARKDKNEYLDMLSKRKNLAARRKKCLLLRATKKARSDEIQKLKKGLRARVKKHAQIRALRALESKDKQAQEKKRKAAKDSKDKAKKAKAAAKPKPSATKKPSGKAAVAKPKPKPGTSKPAAGGKPSAGKHAPAPKPKAPGAAPSAKTSKPKPSATKPEGKKPSSGAPKAAPKQAPKAAPKPGAPSKVGAPKAAPKAAKPAGPKQPQQQQAAAKKPSGQAKPEGKKAQAKK